MVREAFTAQDYEYPFNGAVLTPSGKVEQLLHTDPPDVLDLFAYYLTANRRTIQLAGQNPRSRFLSAGLESSIDRLSPGDPSDILAHLPLNYYYVNFGALSLLRRIPPSSLSAVEISCVRYPTDPYNAAVLRESMRVLKPGGRVTTFDWVRTPLDVRGELEMIGFTCRFGEISPLDQMSDFVGKHTPLVTTLQKIEAQKPLFPA